MLWLIKNPSYSLNLKEFLREVRYCKDLDGIKIIIRHLKLAAHKIWFGWADDETWSLDTTIAEFVLPRLKRFRQKTIAHPQDLTEKEWDRMLGRMTLAFELMLKETNDCIFFNAETSRVLIEKPLEEFGKWFRAIWW